jgi:predicted nucleic acid-binding protein
MRAVEQQQHSMITRLDSLAYNYLITQREYDAQMRLTYREGSSRALMLLGQLYASGRAVVSTQVLQEFCNVGLKKLGLSAAQLQTQLHFFKTYFERTNGYISIIVIIAFFSCPTRLLVTFLIRSLFRTLFPFL